MNDERRAHFIGVDSVVYGVEEMDLCYRFFDDWGLRTLKRTDEECVFETRYGPQVVLQSVETPAPTFQAPHKGPSLREIVWGVEKKRDLEIIGERLSRNRKVDTAPDGTVRTTDPFGYSAAFKVWTHSSFETSHNREALPTETNFVGARKRISEQAVHYARAEPTRIGHAVFQVPNMDVLNAGEAFYVGELGFWLSDRYEEKALFCRCAEESDHHNVAMFATGADPAVLEHVAFEVRDIHEVFGGGLHFAEHGWDTAIGPGRHKVSSAYFWYFTNPAGGQVEYFSDTDFLDGTWTPRTLPARPDTIAEWAVSHGVARFKGFGKT